MAEKPLPLDQAADRPLPEGTVDFEPVDPHSSGPVKDAAESARSDATLEHVGSHTRTEPVVIEAAKAAREAATLAALASQSEARGGVRLDVPAVQSAGSPSVSLANLLEGDLPENSERPVVAGYEILGVLGRGAMGTVYKARQRGIKRVVALKMILGGGHAGEGELSRFRTEAEAVGQLQHPNIVQVYEVGEWEGSPYLSLEYVNGGSLQSKLGGNPQPVLLAAQLVQVLAQTIYCAHQQGIIHRDLKPANVLLMAPRIGGSTTESAVSRVPLVEQHYGLPKIADFGLAKRLEEQSGQTRSGAILGTPSYMAPEQAEGMSRDVGPLADQYALGAILYEMLTGRSPFRGATIWETLDQIRTQEPVPPSRLQPKVPRDLETICLKCLQKQPAKRYPDAAALAEDLRRFVAGEPIHARPVSAAERLWRWCRRHPGVAALSSAVALLLAAVAIGSTLFAFRLAQEKSLAIEAQQRAEVNEALAKENEQKALAAQKVAGEQARFALGTIYDVVTTADEKLRTRADMGPLRKELLQLVMKRLDKISKEAVASGKADRTMGVALQRMGLFYNQMGMTDQEIEVYKRSLEIFQRLMREHPEEDWNPFNAAISYDSVGEIGREIEPDPDKLFDPYLKSLALRRPLVEKMYQPEPSLDKRQRALATTYVKLSALSLTIGDPARAAEYAAQAVRQSESIVAQAAEDVASHREVLSSSYIQLAQAHFHLDREAQARDEFHRCIELRQESVAADAANAYAKQELGRAYAALGDLEMETGHLSAAVAQYHRTYDRFTELAAKDPSNLELQWYRANAAYALATALHAQGDADAKSLYQDCSRVRQKLLQQDPKNPQRKIELMLVLARVGEYTQAAQLAQEVKAGAPRHPGKLFAAACGYALCIPAVREATAKEDYAAKSAEALRQAIEQGYRDAHALAHDPDLEPLRAYPAFHSLQKQIVQK